MAGIANVHGGIGRAEFNSWSTPVIPAISPRFDPAPCHIHGRGDSSFSRGVPIQRLREKPSYHSALSGPRFATRISGDRRRGSKGTGPGWASQAFEKLETRPAHLADVRLPLIPLRSGSMRVLQGKTEWLLCGALLLTSGVPVLGQSAGTASSATSQTQSDKRELLQEEVGDRDLTYLRTRAVFQYDYKEQVEDVTINRARLKLLYAFGPHQNLAVSVMVPVIWKSTATQSAFGSGDMEITAGWVVYASDTFRTGGLVQVVPQTSSENLIGGASTNLKGTWALAWVLSSRFEFTGFFNYKQSVHVSRGGSIKQFEPDVTLNIRVKKSTLFVESDSYLDCITNQFAPMLKGGVSRAFGKKRAWVATVYVEAPLTEYARRTQEIVNTGIDVTWYPFEKK